MKVGPCRKTGAFSLLRKLLQVSVKFLLLFTPVSITTLIDTEDACFDLNASRPIAKGDLKWRDALLVAHRVNSNKVFDIECIWGCKVKEGRTE